MNTAGTPRTDAVSVFPSTTPVNVRPQSGAGVSSTNLNTVPTTVYVPEQVTVQFETTPRSVCRNEVTSTNVLPASMVIEPDTASIRSGGLAESTTTAGNA